MEKYRQIGGGALAAILIVLAVACGGHGSSSVVRPPVAGSIVTTTSVPTATTLPTSTAASSSSPSGASSQQATVTPSTGLASRQTVRVTGAGFSPNESLVITECADKGTNTGPGDCDLEDMVAVTSDAAGGTAAGLPVVKGPFGANKIVCGAQQRCLVSVSQASLSPTEEADVTISFS